jgi:hypothetical protein
MVLLFTPIYYIIDHVILHYVTLHEDLTGVFTGLQSKKHQHTSNLRRKGKTSRQRKSTKTAFPLEKTRFSGEKLNIA